MKGFNTMHLNEATMIEAVQEWLVARWKGGEIPTVTMVKFAGQDREFIVTLSSSVDGDAK